MRRRALLLMAPLVLPAVALLAACGGGGEPEAAPGRLTDPRNVPTATPWAEPPTPIIIEPGAITPIASGGGEQDGEATPPGETQATPQDCGPKYTVVSGDYPGKIAEKCGVSVEELLKANPEVTPTNLHIGDVLNIPQ